MKTTSLATTVLSFLLLALACTKSMMGDPLKDINGNDVKSTLDYFLVPADGNSSGNGLTSGRVQSRPREVILESSYPFIRNGSKIRFSPADNSNGEIIQEGKDLNFIFSELTHNGNSVVWSLDNYDASLENWLVSTAGTVGDYGGKTLLNWFHFHKPGTAGDGTYAYLIHFCPPENINIPSICYFLGIFTPDEEPGSRYLALVLTDKNALPVKLIPTGIVLIGEIGGTAEEDVAFLIKSILAEGDICASQQRASCEVLGLLARLGNDLSTARMDEKGRYNEDTDESALGTKGANHSNALNN